MDLLDFQGVSPPDNYRGCTHSYDCRDHGNRRIWQNVELSLELFVFLIAISKTIGQKIKKKKKNLQAIINLHLEFLSLFLHLLTTSPLSAAPVVAKMNVT